MNIFEKATKRKLRFDNNDGSSFGVLSVEELWDLSLPKLDTIYKQINKNIKVTKEESFLVQESSGNDINSLKYDLVVHIMTYKLDKQEATRQAKERKEEVEELMEILANQEKEAKQKMTPAAIKKRIKELTS